MLHKAPTHVDHAWKAGVMGAVNVLLYVLAVRLTLLTAIAGSIWLSTVVLQNPDPYRVVTLAIYSAVVVVPLVWLARR